MSVNIGFFFLYKDKINQKIIFFKYSVPVKLKHGTTPKIIKATIEDDIKEIKRQIVNGANVNAAIPDMLLMPLKQGCPEWQFRKLLCCIVLFL